MIRLRTSVLICCVVFGAMRAVLPEDLAVISQRIEQLSSWWQQQGKPEHWSKEQVNRGLEILGGVDGNVGCFEGGRTLDVLFTLFERPAPTSQDVDYAVAAHSCLLIGRLWYMRFLTTSHIRDVIIHSSQEATQKELRRKIFTYGPNPLQYAQYHVALVDPQNQRHLDKRVHLQFSWLEYFLTCLCCGIKNVCSVSDSPDVMALAWWVYAAHVVLQYTELHRDIDEALKEYVLDDCPDLITMKYIDQRAQRVDPDDDFGDRVAPTIEENMGNEALCVLTKQHEE